MARPRLSVNVNKVALLRNSRGRNVPDLRDTIDRVVGAGAHGITIHPRRDERHIRADDIDPVAQHLAARHPHVELNIECEHHPALLDRVLQVRPTQCTLVPVRPGEITSDHGYVFPEEGPALRPTVERLQAAGIRVSVFVDCDPALAGAAGSCGADRVELYTGPFAWAWGTPEASVQRAAAFAAAQAAVDAGLEVNAGHDLDPANLEGLRGLPGLREVSIGHWVISRALEVGIERAVGELLAVL